MYKLFENVHSRSGSLPSILNNGASVSAQPFYSPHRLGAGIIPNLKSTTSSPKNNDLSSPHYLSPKTPKKFETNFSQKSHAYELNEPSSPVSPSRAGKMKPKQSMAFEPHLMKTKNKLEQSLVKLEALRRGKEDDQAKQAEERLRKRILESYETEKNPMKAFNIFVEKLLDRKLQKTDVEREYGQRVEEKEAEYINMTDEAAEALEAANKINETVNRIQERYKIKKVSKAHKFYEANIKIFKSLDTFVDAREFLEELNPLKVRKKHKQYENIRAINVLQKIQKESSDYFKTKMQQLTMKKVQQLESPISSCSSDREGDHNKPSESYNTFIDTIDSVELLNQLNPKLNANILNRRKLDYSSIPSAIPIAGVVKETLNPAGLIKPRRRIKQIDEKKKLATTLTRFLDKKNETRPKKNPFEPQDPLKELLDERKNEMHEENEFYESLENMLVESKKREAGIVSTNYNQERSIEAIRTLEKFVGDMLKKAHEQKDIIVSPKKIEEEFKIKSTNVVNKVAAASRYIFRSKNRDSESPPKVARDSTSKNVPAFTAIKPLEVSAPNDELIDSPKPKLRGLKDRRSVSNTNFSSAELIGKKLQSKVSVDVSALRSQATSTFLTSFGETGTGKTEGKGSELAETHGEKLVLMQKKRLNKMLTKSNKLGEAMSPRLANANHFLTPTFKSFHEKSFNLPHKFRNSQNESASNRINEMMNTLTVIKKENDTNRQKFNEFDSQNLQDLLKRKIEPRLESLFLTYERPAPFTQKSFNKIRNIAKRV